MFKVILLSSDPTKTLREFLASLSGLRRSLTSPNFTGEPASLGSVVELWGDELMLRRTVSNWPYQNRAWLVTEHIVLDYQRNWLSGNVSPGVKMVSALHRRLDISHEEFVDYWLGPHRDVAMSYTILPWRYCQDVVREPLTDHEGEEGFVSMHFRTLTQSKSRWEDYPEEAKRGAKDAARFMNISQSHFIIGTEIVWDHDIGKATQ